MSSQCMFAPAREIERGLGLNQWDGDCPPVEGVEIAMQHPQDNGADIFRWQACLDSPAQAVDQRIKMSSWLRDIESRGAHLLFKKVGVAELEALASTHDLTILAAGKDEVVKLFERDASRSVFDRPQRSLAITYVHGVKPFPGYSSMNVALIPGIGEYFLFPALTLSGACHIMAFECIPNGPLDPWENVRTPEEHLAASKHLVKTYAPLEAAHIENVELTDSKGVLAGRFAPTVRRPVINLPSGRLVFGLGDAVVINDPLTGQGANNATKASKVYLDEIVARGELPYSLEWMNATFEKFWDYAQWTVRWTNSLLLPPSQEILNLLQSAAHCPAIASAIVNGFNHPPSVFPWWSDPKACERFIASHQMH
ncbi:putative oxygenase [Burkholderia latens]|nr:putative oxygenase [Burkholderia latens]